MTIQKIHTLILGAGPAGLAAGKKLSEAGVSPVLLERDQVVGGLMRSIKRGQFSVDVGRKELYSRIPEVDQFWTDILSTSYRPYARRIGVLYDGKILETSRYYRGFRRGMPWRMLIGCSIDYLLFHFRFGVSKPQNFEDYRHRKHGPKFSQIFSQGFQEKFKGKKWVEMPPQEEMDRRYKNLFHAIKRKLSLSTDEKMSRPKWRHPARGSGRISELLEQCILKNGGQIQCGSQVTEITTHSGRISTVSVEVGSKTITYHPQYVVSSIPIEFLGQLLLHPRSKIKNNKPQVVPSNKRSAVLVYLFFDEEPRFPHVWLNVSCPKMRAGRITNYAVFNADMVPKNQTCLCVEFFCVGDDALLKLSTQSLRALAIDECARSLLVDAEKCFDHLVIKLPGTDPSANWADWLSETRLELLEEFKIFETLYNVNRAGTDVATFAGLKAADAILTGQRSEFDELADPTRYPPGADWQWECGPH